MFLLLDCNKIGDQHCNLCCGHSDVYANLFFVKCCSVFHGMFVVHCSLKKGRWSRNKPTEFGEHGVINLYHFNLETQARIT